MSEFFTNQGREDIMNSNTNFAGHTLVETKRHTIGDRILEMAANLANRSEQMLIDVNSTLESVSAPSQPLEDPAGTLEETWPPMYHELRNYFQRIERSIEQVNLSLSRAELP